MLPAPSKADGYGEHVNRRYQENPMVYDQAEDLRSSRQFSGGVFARTPWNGRQPKFDIDRPPAPDILQRPALREDAVLVVIRVVDFRSYRIWLDGSATPIDVTLSAAGQSSSLSGAEWLHFYVPRKASAAIPNVAVAPLPYPPSIQISDAIDSRLRECLIQAMHPVGIDDKRLLEGLLKTLLECLLLSLHLPVIHKQAGASSPVVPVRGGLAPWQVRRAKQIMSEAEDGTISIDEMAAACRLSKSHFARAFKTTMGRPPHRWLLEYRVERAKRLMTESRHALAHVALVCGFADQSHFARVFCRFVGCPPGTWRRAQERVTAPAILNEETADRCRAGNAVIQGPAFS
jgi:AraC-like DNA-binding protein